MLFPIRGKIINAFQCSRQKFFENEEVQAITRIVLGKGGYKRNFTIDEVQVSKVIFMADADVDGAHISALLLRMFVMYFPQMLAAGMVYKAVPPLFSIRLGGKDKYFTDQKDLTKYMQKIFLQKYSFANEKGIEINSKEVGNFLDKNTDYVYFMEDISNTYSLDPYLFEMILFHYLSNNKRIDVKKLQKEVKSKYRFMDVNQDKKTGLVEVSGTIKESNIVLINEKLIDDCRIILQIMDQNDKFYYKLNGKISSIYEVMKAYESIRPSNISRFKGLGEMNKEQLRDSTIHPNYDRVLVRYTMEDAKEELEAIREYENNSKKILSCINREITRDELSE